MAAEPDAPIVALARPTFGNVDLCATVGVTGAAGQSDAIDVGVIFWATDARNYYVMGIAPSGSTAVERIADGKAQTLLTTQTSLDDILRPNDDNAGLPDGNHVRTTDIRVVTAGATATVYVDGVKKGSVAGTTPLGERVGLFGATELGLPIVAFATDFAVLPGSGAAPATDASIPATQPSPSTQPAAGPSRSVSAAPAAPSVPPALAPAKSAASPATGSATITPEELIARGPGDLPNGYTVYAYDKPPLDGAEARILFFMKRATDQATDKGQLNFSFYDTPATAAAYVAGGIASPFVAFAGKQMGQIAGSGTDTATGTAYQWVWANLTPEIGAIWTATVTGRVVVIAAVYIASGSPSVPPAALALAEQIAHIGAASLARR
jgi:hypothetical protein